MTFEILVAENAKQVYKMLFGKGDLELKNGNLTFGAVKNLRLDKGKLFADCDIVGDAVHIFEHYGSKGQIAGFPAKVLEIT